MVTDQAAEEDGAVDKSEEWLEVLPSALRRRALALGPTEREQAWEIRLRVGQEPTAVLRDGERPLPGTGNVTAENLALLVELATRASPQAALEQLRKGYLSLKGGHRLGLCGSLWTEEGRARNWRSISSACLRRARAVPNCGLECLHVLTRQGSFPNTLILAPPGGGKTTLLRDLTRLLSDGAVLPPMAVGLCDERGEVAALWEGRPQLDVGARTDVLEGCPKAEGLLMLLRAMTPRILACDEITHPADTEALSTCVGCGVKLLATVHASCVDELKEKPFLATLLERRLFQRAVVVEGRWERSYRVEVL